MSNTAILKELKDNLQAAILVEQATIPIYLYGYYSIRRTNPTAGWKELDARYLYANKAGGVIMSVAVEEMLHMSLSSNILYSLGGYPELYGKSLGPYPTLLPSHRPVGPPGPDGDRSEKIPLAKLSYEQFWHFLQIEYPEKKDAPPQDKDWDTIGQFYDYIKSLINNPAITDADFQRGDTASQIQPDNYSPNNIDTAHPTEAFNPWGLPPAQDAACHRETGYPTTAEATRFSNAADSHCGPSPLMTISSKPQAIEAINTICDQGEGYEHEASADPTWTEQSHYYKFLTLQAQLERYPNHVEALARLPTPPDPVTPTISDCDLNEIIYDYPDNPTTASYAGDDKAQALSNLCNGVYQYMLILTETIFKVPHPGQKLFFNQAMHNSMIWILDKLIQAMRYHQITAGQHKGKILAPTFENIDLGTRAEAYASLLRLSNATKDTQAWTDSIKTLPPVGVYWSDKK